MRCRKTLYSLANNDDTTDWSGGDMVLTQANGASGLGSVVLSGEFNGLESGTAFYVDFDYQVRGCGLGCGWLCAFVCVCVCT